MEQEDLQIVRLLLNIGKRPKIAPYSATKQTIVNRMSTPCSSVDLLKKSQEKEEREEVKLPNIKDHAYL